MLTLAQAAALTGRDRSSLLRAVKRGAISGTRQDDGTWLVDPAELSRVYTVSPQAMQHAAQDVQIASQVVEAKLIAAEARIEDLRNALADMRQQRDDWQRQAERLAVSTPQAALSVPQAAQPTPQAILPNNGAAPTWWPWHRTG
jgi:hypothetical protein